MKVHVTCVAHLNLVGGVWHKIHEKGNDVVVIVKQALQLALHVKLASVRTLKMKEIVHVFHPIQL